ncbi:MAG TPA: two-component regulator propeller domain-containing protein [Pyrinomonadaceae bacterium]|nr:two-component regulator propeller domain-containing protein [Pyrinomonadaceae bacterium]
MALDPTRDLSQFNASVWLTENGLPQNTIHSIIQTRDGYVWLATEEGLARFDGIKFTVFDKQNTPELKSNDIRVLLEDRRGALWIGTADGLIRLLDSKFTAFTTRDGLPSNAIDALCEDHDGLLWVATAAGIVRFGETVFTPFAAQGEFPKNGIKALFADREGALWIGSSEGLARYKNGANAKYTMQDGLASNSVVSIDQDKDARMWVGTVDGLNCLEGNRFVTFTTRDGLPNNRIISLAVDREGSVWIGTPGGLSRFADKHFSSFRPGDGLVNEIILSIFEDREGSLWLGTESGGLSLLKDKKFTTYTLKEGLRSDLVKSIYEDGKGNIWIGTNGGGLSLLKDGKLTTYTTVDGLSSNVVLALFGDGEGNLWVGTPDGLNRFRDGKFKTFTSADGLANDFVRSIYADHGGNLWIGTRGGLTRLTAERFNIYTTADGLPNDFVGTIYEDAQGNIWIGTLGGLSKFKDGKFTTYTTRDGLSSDVVISLHEDADGVLWIGTSGGGLNRLKQGKLAAYTTRNGLSDDVVYSILEDRQNSLWLSSNKGIFRVNKKELDDFVNGTAGSIAPVLYGPADGMITRECSGGGHPAGWRSADGKLWFATIKGVAMIDPEKIKLNDQPPPVAIEQIRVDDESIVPAQTIELGPGKSRLDFYYTALSFVAPEKVRFKYKLEGFDSDWVDGGTRRIAYYTNLRPGRYRFRVIASNNDGLWSPTGAAFDLYLKPHLYQTYWFYAFCALILAMIVWQLYRFRLKRVELQFAAVLAERNRIAREIHDNLAQEMLGISVQLEVVARTMPASAELARTHLDRVRMLVRHGIAEARRYVWDLRSQALDQNDLPAALSETARRLTTETAVSVKMKVSGIFRPLSPLIEGNLLRIGQEAINNAVRHAQARNILINLKFEERRVQLSVRDDGHGFDYQESTNGDAKHFGLVGMQERAVRIGGTLKVDSRAGEGTEVLVDVPISG